MDNEKIGANEMAFATTMLTLFLYKLHYDDKFAGKIAELIETLDTDFSGEEMAWRLGFGIKISPLIKALAGAMNEGMEREAQYE